MNLIIDIGNSRTKFWVFNQEEELFSATADKVLPAFIGELHEKYPLIDKAILSTVREYPAGLKEYLRERVHTFIELDEFTLLPIENLYHSKGTLGKDRLAAATGAAVLYPGSNVLIIDAGTAITYDIVNEKNQYVGGNISPGLNMRYKALNHFTDRLPLIEYQEFNGLFGQSTVEAIHAGVQNGLVFEVDNAINAFKENYRNLNVIITGGNTNFFDKKLKNSFFVHYNLIAIGLNRILEHNGDI